MGWAVPRNTPRRKTNPFLFATTFHDDFFANYGGRVEGYIALLCSILLGHDDNEAFVDAMEEATGSVHSYESAHLGVTPNTVLTTPPAYTATRDVSVSLGITWKRAQQHCRADTYVTAILIRPLNPRAPASPRPQRREHSGRRRRRR